MSITKPQKSRRHKKIKDAHLYDDERGPKKSDGNKLLGHTQKSFNNAPKNIDDQEVPRSVQELMKMNRNPNLMKRKRKKKEKEIFNPSRDRLMEMTDKGMTVPLKPVPNFKRHKNESDKNYINRIERETVNVLQKSAFEKKYDVDFDSIVNKDGKIDRKQVSKKKKNAGPRLKRIKELKKEKLNKMREEKKIKTGFEHLKDKVEFGEVAEAPPDIMSKPRKAVSEEQRKPGKKALLLKDILAKNESKVVVPERRVGETVKRKDQSLAQQRVMDEERDQAIQMYRKMKAGKGKS